MGQYTEALKVSIRRHMKKGKNLDQAYALILGKLSAAMKEYEAGSKLILDIGDDVGILDPQQQSMFDSFEMVRQVTAAMMLDLDTLKNDGWKP